MTDQIAHVSDEMMWTLQKAWMAGKEIGEIIVQLREGLSLRKFPRADEAERLLLYGRNREEEAFEHVVGWLVAVAPGVVVLNTDDTEYHTLRPLSGLLVPATATATQLFVLRPFSPPQYSASLEIWPGTFPERTRRYLTCPAWIDWQIGAGHGESYLALGIDPGRWEILRPWLGKWLPK